MTDGCGERFLDRARQFAKRFRRDGSLAGDECVEHERDGGFEKLDALWNSGRREADGVPEQRTKDVVGVHLVRERPFLQRRPFGS